MFNYQSYFNTQQMIKPSLLPILSTKRLFPQPYTSRHNHSKRTTFNKIISTDLVRLATRTSESPQRLRRTAKSHSILKLTPRISAASCAILNVTSQQFLYQKNDTEITEIASLGKIMTCFLCLRLCKDKKISLESPVTISEKAVSISGTKAGLIEGSQMSVKLLLYGLMLPSGNDAAIALAEYFGSALYVTNKPVKMFIQEMNKLAQELRLNSTKFRNPHGLSYKRNLSCARDVAYLAALALQDIIFQEIVACQAYDAEFRGKSGEIKHLSWKNTNKLLCDGFGGVKTGVTCAAGPCLCAFSEGFVIVLLNCRSLETRWIEAKKLLRWACYNNDINE